MLHHIKIESLALPCSADIDGAFRVLCGFKIDHMYVAWLCLTLFVTFHLFSTGMKGRMNKKGNCLYRNDDMLLTEEQMLQIFGIAYDR